MMSTNKWWLGLGTALVLGLAPMIGCESETEVVTPDGGTMEVEEDGDREYESPTGTETEIERQGDTIEVEQEPAGGL
ncbi:hypothetical protein [Tautonia plasticadhaerens]|uniref:Uncharacterized protein n=1 Tax=Tautonia plasticadhaerens TaxID=2527974 RepID=A0A518GWV6_9BACT|nr:hypothetical protein [Tautonia plasticadhaerens]QDV33075.1 hypothetical protein ElP_09170 [Tautonia plasticadhaerens]